MFVERLTQGGLRNARFTLASRDELLLQSYNSNNCKGFFYFFFIRNIFINSCIDFIFNKF